MEAELFEVVARHLRKVIQTTTYEWTTEYKSYLTILLELKAVEGVMDARFYTEWKKTLLVNFDYTGGRFDENINKSIPERMACTDELQEELEYLNRY